MSVQFGVWNFDGKPIDSPYLEKVAPVLTPYAPDGSGIHVKDNIALLYHAFHTTSESFREKQPYTLASGSVLTWDGRLDNREELIGFLAGALTIQTSDVEIVAAAFQRWETDCFAKLLGDWALTIWDPHARSLVLAKDFAGKRQLYYSADEHHVAWSTVLDPLVLFADKEFKLCEEYIGGWLGFFPAAHLTPYVGIQAVPPASFVIIQPAKHQTRTYWRFDPSKQIRYANDCEYEEHFRSAFSKAAQRTLRADSTIGAHLSGGRDSTSIVCVADIIIAKGNAEARRLETLSYYDDNEPNWNERPFFTLVEQKRGRTGCHIDVGLQESPSFGTRYERFPATPASREHARNEQFAEFLNSHGIRVVLAGTGGDEATGGVPTPIPELEDLIATGDIRTLAHQLKVWALNKRKPWFHLFFQAVARFLPPAFAGVRTNRQPATWLNRQFVRRNQEALQGYENRISLFGSFPTFQENLATLDSLCRQLACSAPSTNPVYETRYPFLDRDLLEFLYAIPRNQLTRPGHTRSLMRRALVGIVPDEILNRKRKAFVSRRPALQLRSACLQLSAPGRVLMTGEMGIVDTPKFLSALQDASRGAQVPLVKVIRTLAIEDWMLGLQDFGVLNLDSEITHKESHRSFALERTSTFLSG